jgi:hypothetical protein
MEKGLKLSAGFIVSILFGGQNETSNSYFFYTISFGSDCNCRFSAN